MPRVAEEDEGSREEVNFGFFSLLIFSFDFFSFNFLISGKARPAPHTLPGTLASLPDRGADQEEAHHHQPRPQVHIDPHLLHTGLYLDHPNIEYHSDHRHI